MLNFGGVSCFTEALGKACQGSLCVFSRFQAVEKHSSEISWRLHEPHEPLGIYCRFKVLLPISRIQATSQSHQSNPFKSIKWDLSYEISASTILDRDVDLGIQILWIVGPTKAAIVNGNGAYILSEKSHILSENPRNMSRMKDVNHRNSRIKTKCT